MVRSFFSLPVQLVHVQLRQHVLQPVQRGLRHRQPRADVGVGLHRYVRVLHMWYAIHAAMLTMGWTARSTGSVRQGHVQHGRWRQLHWYTHDACTLVARMPKDAHLGRSRCRCIPRSVSREHVQLGRRPGGLHQLPRRLLRQHDQQHGHLGLHQYNMPCEPRTCRTPWLGLTRAVDDARTACPAGTFSTGFGDACQGKHWPALLDPVAVVRIFADRWSHVARTDCPANTFANLGSTPGSTSCTPCPVNQDTQNATASTTCTGALTCVRI